MALLTLNNTNTPLLPVPSSSSSSSSTKLSSCCKFRGPFIVHCSCTLSSTPMIPFTCRFRRHRVRMAPEEEKMTRRSPLDFPIEWERPKPGRRPDIFPQFSPMKTPLPAPLPADPPEEDEEEEEEKKEEPEEDPEKEETEKPEQ